MIKTMLAAGCSAAALLCGSLAAAQPTVSDAATLDASQHPAIRRIDTDRARYAPGDTGSLSVELRNNSTTNIVGGVLETWFYYDTAVIGYDQRTGVSLPIGQDLTLSVPFTAPVGRDHRGYRVETRLYNGYFSHLVDETATALDIGTTWTRYPRECWMSRWDSGVDAEAVVADLRAWRCNVIQAYAAYWRPEASSPPDWAPSWASLPGRAVFRSTIQSALASADAANMPTLAFQAIYEAYDDYEDFPDYPSPSARPSREWGSFRTNCAPNCTVQDQDQSPQPGVDQPPNWSIYPYWQADSLKLFNVCDGRWMTHWIEQNIGPWLQDFPWDGVQVDTLGQPYGPVGIGSARYDFDGQPQNSAPCLSNFLNAAGSALGVPLVLNNVTGWGFSGPTGTAVSSVSAVNYTEVHQHPLDVPTYSSLLNWVGGLTGARHYNTNGIAIPAYLQNHRHRTCYGGAIVDCGPQAEPSLRLWRAMVSAAGGYAMGVADHGRITSNVFIEGDQLPITAATREALLRHANFEVAYQHLLRSPAVSTSPAFEPTTIQSLLTVPAVLATADGTTSGACSTQGNACSPQDTTGRVYVVPRTGPGVQIAHLLNFSNTAAAAGPDQDSDADDELAGDWSDPRGDMAPPVVQGSDPNNPLVLRIYYHGNPVVNGQNRLWVASPDRENGRAIDIPFIPASDSTGNYVIFQSPIPLSYWNMYVLELDNRANGDGDILAREPTRGSWYAEASRGVSSFASVASNLLTGRWARYERVVFGATAPTAVSVTSGQAAAATLEFRLGGPTGTLIASCSAAGTGSYGTPAVTTCPVSSSAVGTHDVYLSVTGDAAVYSFTFTG